MFKVKNRLKSILWERNNRVARELYSRNQTPTSLGETLKATGIAFSTLEEITGGNTEEELIEYKETHGREHVNKIKPFLVEFWDRKDYSLDLQSPFVRLALHPKVLAVVSDYVGMWPRLYQYILWETKIMEPGQKGVYSQMWHRDFADKKLINLFVYLNDVDEGAGPFMYIPETQMGGKYHDVFKQKIPPDRTYPPEGRVEEYFKGKILACTAPKGTMIFADTAGLHKGGYSTERPRLMLKILYVTDANYPG
jgi:ectoine hydroxylase-related dioxygenase (phytanoyl-CoA dioxygenase family)